LKFETKTILVDRRERGCSDGEYYGDEMTDSAEESDHEDNPSNHPITQGNTPHTLSLSTSSRKTNSISHPMSSYGAKHSGRGRYFMCGTLYCHL
jgi:hypothetical protein